MHSYNIVIFFCDRFFFVYIILEVLLLYIISLYIKLYGQHKSNQFDTYFHGYLISVLVFYQIFIFLVLFFLSEMFHVI